MLPYFLIPELKFRSSFQDTILMQHSAMSYIAHSVKTVVLKQNFTQNQLFFRLSDYHDHPGLIPFGV